MSTKPPSRLLPHLFARCKIPALDPGAKNHGPDRFHLHPGGPRPEHPAMSWYDYPQYYDLAFRSETRLEADFIEAACRKYCRFPVAAAVGAGLRHRPAGGGIGRPRLPHDGLRPEPAVAGLPAAAAGPPRAPGDSLPGRHGRFPRSARPVDAAYCTFDSFRHLLTEAGGPAASGVRGRQPAARRHLHPRLSPAAARRRRGVHRALDRAARPHAGHRDAPRAGDRSPPPDRDASRQPAGARAGEKELRLRDEFPFRMYTAAQFRRLLAEVPSFELCDVYDFWYEIDHPLKLNDEISDTVFILRKVQAPAAAHSSPPTPS